MKVLSRASLLDKPSAVTAHTRATATKPCVKVLLRASLLDKLSAVTAHTRATATKPWSRATTSWEKSVCHRNFSLCYLKWVLWTGKLLFTVKYFIQARFQCVKCQDWTMESCNPPQLSFNRFRKLQCGHQMSQFSRFHRIISHHHSMTLLFFIATKTNRNCFSALFCLRPKIELQKKRKSWRIFIWFESQNEWQLNGIFINYFHLLINVPASHRISTGME